MYGPPQKMVTHLENIASGVKLGVHYEKFALILKENRLTKTFPQGAYLLYSIGQEILTNWKVTFL